MASPLAVCKTYKTRPRQLAKAHSLCFAFSCFGILIFPFTASPFAIAVQHGINCYGAAITTDSFNSANPTQSTNGQYDPNRASTNGDIACLSGLAQLYSANIEGALFLGPDAAYGLTPNGTISGGVDTNLHYAFPDVGLPGGNPIPAAPLLIPLVTNGVSYDYAFFVSGYFTINNLKNSDSIYVAPNTSVTLLLTGNCFPQNIYVAWGGVSGTAGSLTVYMDGSSFTLGGGAVVDSGNAANLSYYGTTNNTQITFSGNASFTGIIYAPQADFTLSVGGASRYDFVGTIVSRSLTTQGNFSFHFDENLQSLGLCSPQIIAQPQDQSVVSGQDATFNVSANGVFSYQWSFNGTNIPGATGNSLTVTNVTASNGGNYSETIANPWGIQTSTEALLTVLQSPVIDKQPANAAAVLNGDADFVVSAHGLEPLYYQWRANGADLPGATSAMLFLNGIQQADFTDYSVLVTNAVGATLSDTALLSLAVPPSIGPVSINLNSLTLAFPTELGPTYIVEFKVDLGDVSWQEVTRVAGTGQAVTISDNILTTGRKFYRVRLQ